MSLLSQASGLLEQAAQRYREVTAYAKPICRVVVAGNDITAAVVERLISIELTDNRGMEADQLDIALSDHDGLLAIPPRDAAIDLWLGWDDTGLVYKGRYKVDETEHSGAPDTLNIRARSADLSGGLKVKRERSWDATPLATIVSAIATRYGLTPLISAALAGLDVAHLDQANESDANLLTRLGRDHDAIASIKAGRLLFMPTGKAVTVSGLELRHVTLTRADGDQHRYLQASRDTYTGVKAYFYDVNSAKKQEVFAGGGENIKELRHSYTDKASALRAARSEWSRLQRGTATLSYTLAKGRPDLVPDQTYSLTGIKAEIAEIIWLGGNIRHSFTPESFTTALELESQLPDGDLDELAEHDVNDGFTGLVAWYRDPKTGSQNKLTEGDQTKPRRLTHLYQSKASAKRALTREWGRMREQAKS